MNRLVYRGLTSTTRGPTIHGMTKKSSVWYSQQQEPATSLVSSFNGHANHMMTMTPSVGVYSMPRHSYVGMSEQVRHNFFNDFISNFRQIIDENPEYKKNIEDFKKTFLWWRKPKEGDQPPEGQDTGAPGQDAQQQQEQPQQPPQQQQGEIVDEQIKEGEEGKEKVYADKDEEMRDKYKEYYKDFDKRQAEADRINKFKGVNLSKEQTDQLLAAYKEAMGVRPPYPPRNPRDYSSAQDLRYLVFTDPLQLPLRYQPVISNDELDEDYIDQMEEERFPEVVLKLMEVEQELRDKGVEMPPIDWETIDSYEQLEMLPQEIQDYFTPPEEIQEQEKLPIPYNMTNMARRQFRNERILAKVADFFDRLPALGGNHMFYFIGRVSAAISALTGQNNKFTKFFFDHKDFTMPGFEFNKFLPLAKNSFIPEFLEVYCANDIEALEEFCDEKTHKILSGIIKASEAGHKIFDSKVVRIEHLEFKGIRLSKDKEDLYFSFAVIVHHTYCIRDYLYEIVDGGNHEIVKTQMMIHLTIDQDANDFGWVVARLDVRPSESIYL